MMTARARRLTPIDVEIERFERMSDAEVDAELRRSGVDPRATIESVKALIQRRIEAAPRSLAHFKKR